MSIRSKKQGPPSKSGNQSLIEIFTADSADSASSAAAAASAGFNAAGQRVSHSGRIIKPSRWEITLHAKLMDKLRLVAEFIANKNFTIFQINSGIGQIFYRIPRALHPLGSTIFASSNNSGFQSTVR
ncbi:hypothetical protein ACJ73_08820 [Blastomyces percursus]|uniref:Uncharacterized protein n=1 Tax=Blastomyces percursus TaxID=1658174 RepID=A0A1J9QMW2_9EURO|nr:hypothetical protein ACJ73_08820 [Blastomyces percursus]